MVVYIDDVYMATETEKEHLDLLHTVLQRLKAAGLKIGLKKCDIGTEEAHYLGFTFTSEGRTIDEGYLKDITVPQDCRSAEGVLGKLEYVAHNVPWYGVKARPCHLVKKGLRELKGRKVVTHNRDLTNEERENFSILIEHVKTSQVTLELRKPKTDLIIRVQISDEGYQTEYRNTLKGGPIAYKSKAWTDPESKYAPLEKALCACFSALPYAHAVMEPDRIVMVTDFPALGEMKKDTEVGCKAQISRWGKWQAMQLDPKISFITETQKVPLKEHRTSKPPRNPTCTIYTDGSKKGGEDKSKWGFIAKTQQGDKSRTGYVFGSAQTAEVTAVLEAVIWARDNRHRCIDIVTDSDYVHRAVSEDLPIWKKNEMLKADGGALQHQVLWQLLGEKINGLDIEVRHIRSHTTHQGIDYQGNREVDHLVQARALIVPIQWTTPKGIIIPEEEEQRIIMALHDLWGHVGLERMKKNLIKEGINLPPKLKQKFRVWKSQCEPCLQTHPMPTKTSQMDPIKAHEPGRMFSADIGELPEPSKRGHKKFLVIVDNHNGALTFYPIKRATGKIVADKIAEFISHNEGIQSLRMDNGSHFKNNDVMGLLEENKITAIWSIPYASHTNGIAERGIGRLKRLIHTNYPRTWDEPQNRVDIHKILSQGHLKEPPKTQPVSPLFQEGDRVRIKRGPKNKKGTNLKAGTHTVQEVDGNLITLKSGIITHSTQLIRKH